MKATEVIKDQMLSKDESTKFISDFINQQIESLRKDHLINWEQNHRTSQDELEKKVRLLRNKRDELTALIESIAVNEKDTVDISIHFDIQKSKQRVREPEMVAVN